jgi:CofD-related protein of GAK system
LNVRLRITRNAQIPDPVRLARFARAPELGPRILFFSGGSALASLSRRLVEYTHNSTHLITPFDSGGSSAVLRRAFRMPAVGDLRNRMMSLTDRSVTGNPQIVSLFAYRFPKDQSQDKLKALLASMREGHHPLVAAIRDPMRKIIRTHLGFVEQAMPASLDLRGASVGNLVLVGGYLNNGRHLDPVIFLFSKLAEVRGLVRPVINQDLHLTAELADGRLVIGQHKLTGKEAPPPGVPIKHLSLSRHRTKLTPVQPGIRDKIHKIIGQAELICYPMGSFFSSLLATLLPVGVGRAVGENDCPKVFVPNTGDDPELLGHDLKDQVRLLLDYIRRSAGKDLPTASLLNFVMVDSQRGEYPGLAGVAEIKELGVEVIDTRLISRRSRPLVDPELLTQALLSLV